MIMVNGNTWPYLNVEKRRYRFRFLNGCQSRFLILDFSKIPGVEVWQIGNEGGFLAAPVKLAQVNTERQWYNKPLLMALAERADVIVDFTNVPVGGSYKLLNVGPDEPFKGFNPDGTLAGGPDETGQPTSLDPADPLSTGQIMEFRIVDRVGNDLSTPPAQLILPPIPSLTPIVTRRVALLEKASGVWDGPAEALLGIVDENGLLVEKMWMDPITENPSKNVVELWEIYNATADAHPMHVHETAFQVVDREGLALNSEGEVVQPVQLTGVKYPPEPWETGFKDTVTAYPGQVTRIKMKFLSEGQFAWHCHIVEHEDNEMMRPFKVVAPTAVTAAVRVRRTDPHRLT